MNVAIDWVILFALSDFGANVDTIACSIASFVLAFSSKSAIDAGGVLSVMLQSHTLHYYCRYKNHTHTLHLHSHSRSVVRLRY